MKKPRRLAESEIMVKVVECTETDVTLVLYTKPNIVMRLMDETFGPDNWQSEHTAVPKGNGLMTVFCRVSVYDEERGRWISRDDAGEPVGNMSDKSQSTDAFKRACALFGVAKELKTMPESIVCRTYMPETDKDGTPVKINGFQNTQTLINVTANEDGSFSCHDTFSIVQYLLDDNGNICALCIEDDTTHKRVFTRDYREGEKKKKETAPSATITPLTSPELARYSLQKADVGTFAKQGMTIGQLKPDEMVWLFGKTQSQDIKRGLLELSMVDPDIKNAFLKSEIIPDQLLKSYR